MTRVAVYARYSSDGQRETSVEDQFRICAQYATREGWQIVKKFEDKAISGMKGESDRDGFAALLKGAKAKQFDVVLIHDLSRLTRDSMKMEQTRRQFVFWGVRLIGVNDGIDTDHEGNFMMSGVKGIFNQQYLLDLAKHTHRGLTGQALKGNNCGGRAYGYKHVPLEHPTEKDEYGRPLITAVKREIDEEQAKWVRQVFQWYAEGWSPRKISDELNRRKIPSPGASYHRKTQSARQGTWSASALHGHPNHAAGILCNVLYIGKQVWNRRQWVRNPETGRKVPRLRPESEWIVTDQSELRIISQDLWDRVQQRRTAQKKWVAKRKTSSPKYLLSSLLRCAECESNFVLQSYYQYGCAGHKDRGPSVCRNSLKVSRTLVEDKILAGLRKDLFTQEGLDLFIKETTKLLTDRRTERQPDHSRLPKVEKEIANIMKAIKAGILTPTTKAELEQAEAERSRLLEPQMDNGLLSILPRAKERYQALIEGIGALSSRHLPQAREQIRALVGEIWLRPTKEGYLEATLEGRYEGFVKLTGGGKLNLAGCGGRI